MAYNAAHRAHRREQGCSQLASLPGVKSSIRAISDFRINLTVDRCRGSAPAPCRPPASPARACASRCSTRASTTRIKNLGGPGAVGGVSRRLGTIASPRHATSRMASCSPPPRWSTATTSSASTGTAAVDSPLGAGRQPDRRGRSRHSRRRHHRRPQQRRERTSVWRRASSLLAVKVCSAIPLRAAASAILRGHRFRARIRTTTTRWMTPADIINLSIGRAYGQT